MLDEYAIRFFALIQQSKQIDAEKAIENIVIASSPHIKDRDRRELISSLEKEARDIIDIATEEDSGAGLARLKRIFGK